MTIKYVLLKSGEGIIADVQEMVVGSDDAKRVVGYFLNKPCLVRTTDSSMLEEVLLKNKDKENKIAYQVSLYPWLPMSEDTKVPVSAEWVVTIVEPLKQLKEKYINDVVQYGKQTDKDTSIDEQSNIDFTD